MLTDAQIDAIWSEKPRSFYGHSRAIEAAVIEAGASGAAQDAKRLDWLESHRMKSGGIVQVLLLPCGAEMCFTQIRGGFVDCENFPTVKGGIRAAIDEAVEAQQRRNKA